MTKIRMIVLPDEVMGEGPCPFDPEKDSESFLNTLQSWAKDGFVGDEITLEIIEMTQEEIDAIPEI